MSFPINNAEEFEAFWGESQVEAVDDGKGKGIHDVGKGKGKGNGAGTGSNIDAGAGTKVGGK
eukprot:2451861-Karenia_brevis.AAC.1